MINVCSTDNGPLATLMRDAVKIHKQKHRLWKALEKIRIERSRLTRLKQDVFHQEPTPDNTHATDDVAAFVPKLGGYIRLQKRVSVRSNIHSMTPMRLEEAIRSVNSDTIRQAITIAEQVKGSNVNANDALMEIPKIVLPLFAKKSKASYFLYLTQKTPTHTQVPELSIRLETLYNTCTQVRDKEKAFHAEYDRAKSLLDTLKNRLVAMADLAHVFHMCLSEKWDIKIHRKKSTFDVKLKYEDLLYAWQHALIETWNEYNTLHNDHMQFIMDKSFVSSVCNRLHSKVLDATRSRQITVETVKVRFVKKPSQTKRVSL